MLERGARYVLETILLESKPVLFAARLDYDQWREQVARAAKLREEQVLLMGSAVTGFSLAPMSTAEHLHRSLPLTVRHLILT